MLEALSAEALKMRRHKATWFLVWLYPIAFSVIMLLAIGAGLAGADQPGNQTAADWVENTAIIWFVPNNSMGRYLIAGFVTVVFAGEYGWNTWKLIVPHRSRTALIAAKFALIAILFAIAFTLTALLTILFSWLDSVVTGEVIPGGVTAAMIRDMHGRAALAAVAPFLVTVAYASLAAVLTRSTLAALIIAILATTLEQIIFSFGVPLSLRFPGAIDLLYPSLPGYHIANLGEWIREGQALSVAFPAGHEVAFGWAASATVIASWTLLLASGALLAFRRQDIN